MMVCDRPITACTAECKFGCRFEAPEPRAKVNVVMTGRVSIETVASAYHRGELSEAEAKNWCDKRSWCFTCPPFAKPGTRCPLSTEPPEDKSTNPKKAMGMAKPPMHLIPATALVHLAMSFKDGAAKYGPYNWRIDPVDTTTYVAAAKRHLDLYFDRQRLTSDSKVHNLGAVMACCAILLDAEAMGNLIDDRPPSANLEVLMDEFTVGKGIMAPAPEDIIPWDWLDEAALPDETHGDMS